LGIRVTIDGAGKATAEIVQLEQAGAKAEARMGGMQKAAIGLAGAFAGLKFAEFVKDTLNLGARYETLGVVMDVVGRNAGKTRAEMDAFQKGLQQTGISSIGARESLARMAGAQLDLAKSSQIARLAQDAAVIANTNSTAAFETLINGITTGQPRILRTLGIFVDMEEGQKKYAKSLGTTAEALSAADKIQANMNTVLAAGGAIAGTYAAAMGTAGKQLQSTVRYLEDAREKASTAFQPAYTTAVFAYAAALKFVGEHATTASGAIAGVATALGLIALALAAIKVQALLLAATPIGLALTAAIVAAGVAVGAYVKSVADARHATEEWATTIKEMSTHSLRGLIASTLAQIGALREQNLLLKGVGHTPDTFAPGAAAKIAELETRLRAYTDALKANEIAEKGAVPTLSAKAAALKAEQEAVQALAQSYTDKAAATQREIAYLTTHREKAIALTVELDKLKAIQDKIADDAARQAAGMGRLAGMGTGAGRFPIAGGFQGGAAPGVSDALAQQNSQRYTQFLNERGEQYAKAWLAAEEKAQQGMKEIRDQFMKQFQQTMANGIADMLEHGLSSWRSFFGSIKSMFVKMFADIASAKLMDKIFKTTTASSSPISLGTAAGAAGFAVLSMAVITSFVDAAAAARAHAAALRTAITDFITAGTDWKRSVQDWVVSLTGSDQDKAQRDLQNAFIDLAKAAMEAFNKYTTASWGGAQPVVGSVAGIDAYIQNLQFVLDHLSQYALSAQDVTNLTATINNLNALKKTWKDLAEAAEANRKAAEAQAAAEKALADQRSRDSLAIRLLTAQGDETGAFAARQALELQQAQDEKRSQAYIDLLKQVLAAEATQRTMGAAGTTSTGSTSAGTIVARQMSASVTSFQGDRLVDELASQRILARTFWPYLKTIAENTAGLRRFSATVDGAMGEALQSAEHRSGNSMMS
jgi:hypothetical protein